MWAVCDDIACFGTSKSDKTLPSMHYTTVALFGRHLVLFCNAYVENSQLLFGLQLDLYTIGWPNSFDKQLQSGKQSSWDGKLINFMKDSNN